jgi:hypothetical protein
MSYSHFKNPLKTPNESKIEGISGSKQGATPACPHQLKGGGGAGCQTAVNPTNFLTSTANCGQSMHVRKNPLFSRMAGGR